ncbi:MAG: MG2 domain-containing protein [Dethiosulfovibrio sp.]|nr:MG2 domain-containing protein [Dethiosulfovibrio sp.]
MKVKFLARWILLSLALCGTAWADDFSVKSFSPQGEVTGKPEIKVIFSSPVVESGLLGKVLPDDQVPLIVEPSVKGSCVWDSVDTLVLVPGKPLTPATEYRASMKAVRDLSGRLLAGPQSFSFNTAPLKLKSIRQVEFTPYRELTLRFEFSLPIPPQRLLGFVSATSDGTVVRLIPQGESPSKSVSVKTEYVPGEKVSVKVGKGLASDLGPLGLAEDKEISIALSSGLSITGGYAESQPEGKGRINIYTSRPVDPGEVKGFVSVSPERKFRVEPIYGGFALVGDFAPRDRYTVTVKKGLGGEDGLKVDDSRSFVIPDMEKSVTFAVSGTFLTPMDSPRIPLETVNLDRVQVSAWKLYPNNVALVTGALNSGTEPPKALSRNIGTKQFDVDNRLNRAVRGALDLDGFLGDKKGVFLLEASDGEGGWNVARQMVTLTDLGISARVWESGLLVWVNGLSDAEPISDASVTVYSSSNQILSKGTTDKDGLWTMSDKDRWDPQLRPAVITVEKGDDLSFLALEGDKFSDSGVDVFGSPWVSSYEAESLIPRGIYRPGETVEITSIVRGAHMALPGEFPVLWKVINPMDGESARGSQVLSRWGSASVSFDVPGEAPTGKYRFELSVPGGDAPLCSTSFLVEDFTPPRIELELVPSSESSRAGEDMELSFKASYLFGAPSPALPWEMQVTTTPRQFRSKLFPNYTFGDVETQFNGGEEYIGSGSLDDQGKGELSWTVPDHWKAPSMIDLHMILQAMEPGGRWVSRSVTIPCALSPYNIGIRAPEGDLLPGKAASFGIAAVTDEDKAASPSLRWELFSVIEQYVMVREEGRTRMRWQEEKVAVSDGKLSLKDGKASLSLTPDQEGRYLLVLSDGKGSSGSVRFDSWRPWDGSSKSVSIPDRIDLSLGKGSVSYRAPFPGRGLFTLESDGLISAKVLNLDLSGEIKFDTTDDMWPNGWCSLQVIRPVSEKGKWGPHRALGALSIPINNEGLKALVTMEVPKTAEPEGTVGVKVSVKDEAGQPLSGQVWLAMVDRGILGLTDHKVPDPWRTFTSLRQLGSRASDLYDELIPIESRETPLLHPAGGAGAAMMALNLSPLRARGFKVLSMVKEGLEVKDGVLDVSFDIPEFSGGADIVAVFIGSKLGSASSQISIAREVTVDPSVPSVLAPGDLVQVPLSVISTSSSDLKLSVAVEASGQWTYEGKKSLDVSIPSGGSTTIELPFRASESSGYGGLTIGVTGTGLDFSVSRETVIRPPMPRISLSETGVAEVGTKSFKEKGRWFPGTMTSSLYLSGSQKADLLPAISFLRGYPYTCLEQTVSTAWPLVVLPNMIENIESKSSSEVEALLRDVITRLQALQLYDGSFVSWPNGTTDLWGSVYASHLIASVDPSLVPGGMTDRIGNFLRSVLSDPSEDGQALSRKAYSAYVVALLGQAPLGWMEWLSERVGQMDEAGRSFLAGAYGVAGKKEKGLALMGKSIGKAVSPYGSPLRDQAIRLIALEALAPGGADEALLANQIAKAIAQGELSTQEAGLSVLALGGYVSKADIKPFSATLTDGENVLSLSTGDDLVISSDLEVVWTLKNDGPGRVFWGKTTSGVPLDSQPNLDQGIKVRRVLTDRDGNVLDLSSPLELGQEIVVKIRITPTGPVSDLVVVDVLPGCFDVWNPALESGEESVGARREVRFDRVLFFPERVDKEVTVGYRCRVISRGDFALPPISAESMYNPGIRSLSGEGRITVR